MTARAKPPYRTGDPRTVELGRLGGKASGESRRRKAASDPLTRGLLGHLIGLSTDQWFDRLGLTEPSWNAWRMIGKVLDGLPLDVAEMTTYRDVTGRQVVPTNVLELLAIVGRGSGKTTGLGAVQAIRAAMRGYAIHGIPRVLLLAFVKEQAGVCFEIVSQMLDGDAELRKLITSRTRDTLTLAHGVRIQTISSNYRSVRAYSVAFAFADELAYWWNDDTNANPDVEVLRALRPGLGKVPGSRLIIGTSPWTEEGAAYEMHQRHYGQDGSDHTLVLRAPTLTFNPSYDKNRIAAVEQDDPESAASEFGAAWRVAGGTLVTSTAYDACVDAGIAERSPVEPLGDDHYVCAVDLSGGTGEDSAALTIGHVETDGAGVEHFVQDLLHEWLPKFDPGVACGEIAAQCRRFGITEVVGDQFSAGFAASEFRRHALTYVVSGRTTSACALDSIAVLNTRRVRLLEHAKLRKQYLGLRRDFASGGRPTILESRKHDDLAVATARGITAALGLGEVPEHRPRARVV